MRFVEPEQAPDQAEVIKNTQFLPDVDFSDFRSVIRTDRNETSPRRRQLIRTAMSEVNTAPVSDTPL
ncbi:head completion/stabilization protein, partial [Klebsiella pneumoniae]|nr:head completion/stabilization protein [Klebsiella pneumoniae]